MKFIKVFAVSILVFQFTFVAAAVAQIPFGFFKATLLNQILLLAGSVYGPGNIDGVGSGASFYQPYSLAVDASGNILITDVGTNSIRKMTLSGSVTTFAGSFVKGSADGIGSAAQFNSPRGIAGDSSGNVFVVDSLNQTIRKISATGVVTTFAGTPGVLGSDDGVGSAATFNFPTGIAIDSSGNLYVADAFNSTIRKITSSGTVSTFAGSTGNSGSSDGLGNAAQFYFPQGIAIDNMDQIYVTDTVNSTIRMITPSGLVSTLAGSPGFNGSNDGTGAAATFNNPSGITVDSLKNVYVVDSFNSTIRKITSSGVVSTLAGAAGQYQDVDGHGSDARFYFPFGITIDTNGNLYISDLGNFKIRKINTSNIVSTIAGSNIVFGSDDGQGAAATFAHPYGIVVDSLNNAYVTEQNNSDIRKIDSAGNVSTFAGSSTNSGSADGVGTSARFSVPTGIALDKDGNLFVSDQNRFTIRKISPAGVVTTFAGSDGVSGSNDGQGASASFNNPVGLACDSFGNVFVADSYNFTIRKITPTGYVSTFAGTAGNFGSTDANGAAASFGSPAYIAIDSSNILYVTDAGNQTIRKISPSGEVTTLAGTQTAGFDDGQGTAASFNLPQGIAVDSAGNLYVADTNNNLIRKITPAGVVSTILGSRTKMGFLLGALPGALIYPTAIAVSGSSLFITNDNAVLKTFNLLF